MSKYSKLGNRQSPYINKAGVRNNSVLRSKENAKTDSELYQGQTKSIHHRSGPTGIGGGSRNASLTLAQRQQQRREQEKAVLEEVESQKKAVLEKLNKIQSKKFS